MGFLSNEQMEELIAQDTAEAEAQASGSDPAPAKSEADTGKESATEVEEYVEDTPAKAEPPRDAKGKFRAKVQGEEVEVDIYDESGNVRQDLIDRFQMGEDYHRKTNSLAEERRAIAEERRHMEARIRELEARMSQPKEQPQEEEDPLADYDPEDQLVKTTKAAQKELADLRRQQEEMRHHLNTMRQQAQAQELEALETQMLKDNPELTREDVDRFVGAVFYARVINGQQTEYKDVAKEFAAWKRTVTNQAIEDWKQKHRKTKDAPPQGASPAGSPPKEFKLGDKSIINFLEEQDRMEKTAANR